MLRYAVAEVAWNRSWYEEARALAEAHFAEVDGGIEPKRPFCLDLALMDALANAGALLIVEARQGSALIGYFSWQVSPDVESEGLLIAQQGAWYVKPGHFRAAAQTFDASLVLLRARGVQCAFPHHRTQGRGAHIGRFFQRRGAKPIQTTYSLWIGA